MPGRRRFRTLAGTTGALLSGPGVYYLLQGDAPVVLRLVPFAVGLPVSVLSGIFGGPIAFVAMFLAVALGSLLSGILQP